jgi:gliding motility-associated protein GldL
MFNFFESKRGKNLMSKLYGWGASVVILGAMFKILHWDGADLMLTLGLTTEAVIFFISGFEKPHSEYDWSLVYPELAGMNDDVRNQSPVQELDNMLVKAKVDSELIQSLGDGLRKVNKAANGIGSVTDIADSTQEYSKQVTEAAKKLENINGLYEAQIRSSVEQTEATKRMAANMTSSLDNAEQMRVEMEMLKTNLSELNSVYGNMLSAMTSNK